MITVAPDSVDARAHRRQLAFAVNQLTQQMTAILRPAYTGAETRVVTIGTYYDPVAYFKDYGLTPGQGDRIYNVNWQSGAPSFWQYDAVSGAWKSGPTFP